MKRLAVVDESKVGPYLMVCCSIDVADAATTRAMVRGMVMQGQLCLHMTNESDPRRRAILSLCSRCTMITTVYVADRSVDDRTARSQCLRAIVGDEALRGTGRLVLDSNEPETRRDNRILIEARRSNGCEETLTWAHAHRNTELLLGLPDAIAWAWPKGGDWRRRVTPFTDVCRV